MGPILDSVHGSRVVGTEGENQGKESSKKDDPGLTVYKTTASTRSAAGFRDVLNVRLREIQTSQLKHRLRYEEGENRSGRGERGLDRRVLLSWLVAR